MDGNFDGAAFGEKLVKIFGEECHPLVPQLVIERAECQKKMIDEINPLNPDQMRAVGLKLERRITNAIAVEVLIDSDARVTGFSFKDADNWSHPLVARHKSY
jgi:hypothetical protein